jgi:alpha-tubulin suppressor-like RCC1 family protein
MHNGSAQPHKVLEGSKSLVKNCWSGVLLLAMLFAAPAHADSSSPRLAAYYDRQMAIVAGKVFAWEGQNEPVEIPIEAIQVGVGRDRCYVLSNTGKLISFQGKSKKTTVLMVGIKGFSAGHSGVLGITNEGALWWMSGKIKRPIASSVSAAAVGDGANYYISSSGELFVMGSAHRGQYGDGRLEQTDQFVRTASGAAQITAHTGHAILLTKNGDVLGTGGNIYGPVGNYGLGDKAVRWSKIMSDVRAIATGSSHSLAIRKDGTLMAWGNGYGVEAVSVLSEVVAVAAGSRTTIAIKRDDTLWQWGHAKSPKQLRLPKQ